MQNKISDIKILGVVRGNSTSKATMTNRASSTFIYKESGESVYHLRGKDVRLSKGTVLFIPENECYSFEKTSAGESVYCLINFHSRVELIEKPTLFSLESAEYVSQIFSQLQTQWHLSYNDAESFELLSLFYHLAYVLLKSQDKAYHTASRKSKLDPAIAYLENNLYNPELTVAKLAALCGISEVAFRNVFFDRFGETPKKYIVHCRLLKAKNIIESGEYSSIGEVANIVGYQDALYFSKHFKSYFGFPPSKT